MKVIHLHKFGIGIHNERKASIQRNIYKEGNMMLCKYVCRIMNVHIEDEVRG